jgi:hypothetical protein
MKQGHGCACTGMTERVRKRRVTLITFPKRQLQPNHYAQYALRYFLIAARYQGCGKGKIFLRTLIDKLKRIILQML